MVTKMPCVMKIIVFALILAGCNDVPDAEAQGMLPPTTQPANTGFFKGVVGDHAYLVNVECSNLEQDFFSFKSDRTEVADSNRDGVIISGTQNGQAFGLTVIDNGAKFSTAKLANFKKLPDGAQGSGTLFLDNSEAGFEGHFTVVCK